METIGALAALSTEELERLSPGKVGRILQQRACGIDPRTLETSVENVSISHEETFERDVEDRARLQEELRRMATSLARHLSESGQSARTVTTKLRYPDFSIRSRSTTVQAGIDDAERIGDLACKLLDRALEDRPGALRLVGVSVSGLQPFRQLELV